MVTKKGTPDGRKARATRNDRAILDAAREVFIHDPDAPVSAVAKQAGVGISAIYLRYAGKEELLQTLCAEGLHRFIAAAADALAEESDPWEAFARFVRAIVDADVHSLTVHLAGTFTPTAELYELTEEANTLAGRLFGNAQSARALRADLHLNDLAMLLEQLTAVRLADDKRTRELRHRYLALQLDAFRPAAATTTIPGPPPSSEELGERWIPR